MRRPSSPSVRRGLPFNALSWALGLLEKVGLVQQPLHAQALIAAAQHRTGLDDFGDETFRAPLSQLITSCATEARLNIFGRCALAQDLLQLLTNRLQIQRDRKKWLQIGNETIVAPVFIAGLPRTGTTLLHGLLAQDHDSVRAPATWEVMFPSPPPTFGEKRRIKRAERRLACFDLLAPEFRKIHPMAALFPQECIAIMSHSFVSDQFCAMYDIPTYQSWLLTQDMKPAYKFHRQFLQHLQYGNPPRRFVLKAPAHLLTMETLFETYPDALVVQTHREPLEVLPSAASLTTVLQSIFSDDVDPTAIGLEMTKYWENALKRLLNARRGLRSQAFFDVDYSDLTRDPIAIVRRIYDRLEIELSPSVELRMRSFLRSHSPARHGRHTYSLAEFGMDPEDLSERFSSYRRRFNLPDIHTDKVSLSP